MTGKGKTLVGFVMSRIAPPEAEILTIAVDLGQRKRGIGRTLLSHHLSRLAASGINCVFLEVDEGNVPALKLYKGLGFEKVGQRPGYYAMKDGTRATALVLRADID
ncbi:MAG: ribosomal-protein-alanine acetyltransferase [Hyphomicrobiales bacterium]|nr:ribosomal-protein-alanine acetyltransferase [Hyphomicrobiales bacterium]